MRNYTDDGMFFAVNWNGDGAPSPDSAYLHRGESATIPLAGLPIQGGCWPLIRPSRGGDENHAQFVTPETGSAVVGTYIVSGTQAHGTLTIDGPN